MVANIHRELLKNFWLGHNPAWFDQMDNNYPRYNIVGAKVDSNLKSLCPVGVKNNYP